MKDIMLSKKFLFIPILIILILSLGTVSASSLDLDDSSDIDFALASDASDINVASVSDDMEISDSIEDSDDVSIESNDAPSCDILGDEGDGDDSTDKPFSEIQSAIDAADENATIELSGTYSGNEKIKVNKSLNFVGKDETVTIKWGEDIDRLFDLGEYMEYQRFTLKFENIKFLVPSESSRSYIVWDDYEVSKVIFSNCILEHTGTVYGDINIENCVLNDFIGYQDMGGIFVKDSKINNSFFTDQEGFDKFINCNFTNNCQIVASMEQTTDIYGCNFDGGNVSAVKGHEYGSNLHIINCTFKNYVSEYGGALDLAGYAEIINCAFINNSATEYGGAINLNTIEYIIENCSFINNSAKYGTAINLANYEAIHWNISNCIFDNNHELGSDSISKTLYYYSNSSISSGNSSGSTGLISRSVLTVNNNFWGSNFAALSHVYSTNTGKTIKMDNILTLKLKSNGNNSYTLYFANASGSKVSKMPDYSVTIKDRRDGSVIAEDLLLVNGQATFKYSKTLNMDVIDIINQRGRSVTALSTTVNASNFTAFYKSGKIYNIKVVDKYSKEPISGLKLKLKVYTGRNYKFYYVTTNSKGVAAFKGSGFAVGTHKVVMTTTNTKYVLSKTSYIKILKAKTVLSAPKVSAKYKKSAYFKVTVKDKNTKKVVSGLKLKLRVYTGKKYKTYNVKTNAKGIASFNTKVLAKGTHKVKILSGNSNYAVSGSSSIKIS